MSYHPTESTVQLQTSPAYYAFIKALNTIGYFGLLWLTLRFLDHKLDWQLATGCVLLSACWLILTRIKIDHLLQTYFDILSRLEVQFPVVIGTIMSLIAALTHTHPYCRYAGGAEMLAWCYIWVLFRRNKSLFKKQGYGPVPFNTYINPPLSILRVGDLLLTSGNVAKNLHESVGHAEMVLQDPNGRLWLFSSYMKKGACFNPIEEVTGSQFRGYYVGLHLREPWSVEQQQQAFQLATEMVRINQQWAADENVRVKKRIEFLPLPRSLKDDLIKLFHSTGYDWFGTFMGRIAHDRWTCIGACVELYRRMGVRLNFYGTGLLGFGTTLFDPIIPARFLCDPAFELIQDGEDKEAPDAVPSPAPS
jgi:hypothetical protein